jgi:hypothetical protein
LWATIKSRWTIFSRLRKQTLMLSMARRCQEGLKNIEAGMSGIANFLNYIESTFRYTFGQFWDPGGNIRASIKTDLAMISGANTDWPQLIAAGERLGIRIEEEEDKARQQQQQQQQMLMP